MKIASSATLAILASGSYLVADLYSITLSSGVTYYYTGFDTPITAAIATGIATFGSSYTYHSGWTITRGTSTQSAGVDAQELELTIAPAWDNPGGPPTIGGYQIQQAVRLGLLDNASVLYAKLFMTYPAAGSPLDTSPGAVAWFQGAMAECDVGRFAVQMKISSNLLVLNQVQMPRNLYQASCVHTLYDAGCAATKANFTCTGTAGGVTSNSNFGITITAKGSSVPGSIPDSYFELGTITFTSGLNAGYTATVKIYASSTVQTMIPFPANIAFGDAFTIIPGCDKLQSTCVGKFSNLIHFKGFPFIPVAETLYDGGTSNPPNAAVPVTQAGQTIGSTVGGQIIAVTG